ncbi:hypothetical protein Peur_020051 [Populus x canadensis]
MRKEWYVSPQLSLPSYFSDVEHETRVQEANWQLYKKQRAADAVLYDKMKEAEAQQATGDAALYSLQQAAQGDLYKIRNKLKQSKEWQKHKGFT